MLISIGISDDPAVHPGDPCSKGARVSVSVTVGSFADRDSVEQILRSCPQLSREEVQAALRTMKEQRFPLGGDEQRVKGLLAELDARTEEEWIAGDEAAARRQRPATKWGGDSLPAAWGFMGRTSTKTSWLTTCCPPSASEDLLSAGGNALLLQAIRRQTSHFEQMPGQTSSQPLVCVDGDGQADD